jgi:hypothetical protein
MRLPLRGVAHLVAATLLVVGPVSASAQVPAFNQLEEQVEPLYVGWIFTPTFATGANWDNNLLLLDAGDNVLRDYGIPVSPSLSLAYRGRRTTLTSSYGSAFHFYREITELNSSQQGVFALLQHRATPRITVFVQQDFNQAPSTDVLTLPGLPFYRVGTRASSTQAGLAATLARGTVLDLTYTLGSVAFDFDEQAGIQLEGGHAHRGSVALSRAVSPRLSLGGRYELQHAILASGADRFNIQNGVVTGEYRVTPQTTITAELGVASLDAGQRQRSRVGPAVGATISRRAALATMTFAYHRAFIPSWGFGGTFQNEEWLLSVRVPFARNRAYLQSRAALLNSDALDSGQPGLRSVWLGGALGYRATRWLSVEGYYDGSGQDTNRPGGDRRRDIIGFRIVTSKPMKLR